MILLFVRDNGLFAECSGGLVVGNVAHFLLAIRTSTDATKKMRKGNRIAMGRAATTTMTTMMKRGGCCWLLALVLLASSARVAGAFHVVGFVPGTTTTALAATTRRVTFRPPRSRCRSHHLGRGSRCRSFLDKNDSSSSSAAAAGTALGMAAKSSGTDVGGGATSASSRSRVAGSNSTSDSALFMAVDSAVEAAVAAEVLHDTQDRTERINSVALVNAAIVGSLGFSVFYELFHERIAAIAALYEYGLGRHGPEITMAGVAIDLIARVPADFIHVYETLIPTNPIFYKACTSGVAYGLGDFLSQVYQGRSLETIDLPRSFRSGAAGFIAHGPLCHFWLLFMETYLDFDGAWWATGIKVTADLTVWSIFLNAAYSTIIGLLAFRNPIDVLKDVRVTLWPALRSAWRFWPFVHTVSFSHAVPLDLKLLWVDVMEVVWVTILSKVANEDKNSKLKDHPEAEFAVVVEAHNVDPSLEIELTREEELDPDMARKLSFELPQKVLGACWPLIAMWPVLYAGYRVEEMLGLVQH